MLRPETESDDRERNGGNRDGASGYLRDGLALAAASLGRRRREASAGETRGTPTRLTRGVTRVRELMASASAGGGDANGRADRRETLRSVATDKRVRNGVTLALALLAGMLLAERRGDGGATDGASRTEAEGARERDHEAGTRPVDAAVDATRPAEIEATEVEGDVTDFTAPRIREMPMLGLGTYPNADYDECVESVRRALDVGYRHVDATERREGYYNETAVGDAVAQVGVPREDLFVATKVSPEDLDYDHVFRSVEESLDRLGMEYIDLLYVHWPTGDYEVTDTLDAFADLREEGLIERIGVSNFTVDLLEEAVEVADEPIFANQVEMHPLLPQTELREFCARDDVNVELVAYSPIARGNLEAVGELREVAGKYGATPEQVSLAWLREKGVTAIPESTSEDHLRENWLSLGVELDDDDMEKIDSIEERRRIVDPDEAPWNW
ncbi:aldo/keto reductase [Halorussus limi]